MTQSTPSVEDDDSLVIRPVQDRGYRRRRRVTMEELLKGYEGDYHPEELDWGPDVGAEVVE